MEFYAMRTVIPKKDLRLYGIPLLLLFQDQAIAKDILKTFQSSLFCTVTFTFHEFLWNIWNHLQHFLVHGF